MLNHDLDQSQAFLSGYNLTKSFYNSPICLFHDVSIRFFLNQYRQQNINLYFSTSIAIIINYQPSMPKIQNDMDQDSQRSSTVQKPKTKYFFESYGENIHFLYTCNYKFEKQKILMHSIDERNICMKSVSNIFVNNQSEFRIQHKENVLECLFYPFYTNQYRINKNNKYFGTVKEGCCRIIHPCNCFCGKMNQCSNETVQIFDQTGLNIITIQGTFSAAFQICQEFTKYQIYGQTKEQIFGTIKQYMQVCKMCPCHCSCLLLYSPILKRRYQIEIDTDKLQTPFILERLFVGLMFLTKITKSFCC